VHGREMYLLSNLVELLTPQTKNKNNVNYTEREDNNLRCNQWRFL
jgi:hypothetical protein